MAITLDTTIGGPNANAYVDVTYVDAFAPSTPYAAGWAALITSDDKNAAIIRFTRALESMFGTYWSGEPTYETQALGYPRRCVQRPYGTTYPWTTIPKGLLDASALGAAWTAAQGLSADPFGLDDAAKLSQLTVGPIALTFRSDVGVVGVSFLADIIEPMLAAALLIRAGGGQAKLIR